MEFIEIYKKIQETYNTKIAQDKGVARFYAKLRDGTATYADALTFAKKTGEALYDACNAEMLAFFPDGGIPPEAIADLMPPALKAQCREVLDNAAQVQKGINRKAGVGLNPVNVEVSEDRVTGLVTHLQEYGITKEAKGLIVNLAQSQVDKTAHKNADFQTKSGMRVTVSRFYDDVGVNHRTETCKWCMDRTGVDIPYKIAYNRGMFERHPGCGCTIEYKTEKTAYIGRGSKSWWNWEEDPSILEKRKTYGLTD